MPSGLAQVRLPGRAIGVGGCVDGFCHRTSQPADPRLTTKRSLDRFTIHWHRPCVRLVSTKVDMPLLDSRG
jgi:hypothetical protein